MIDMAKVEEIQRKQKARRSQRLGADAEQIIINRLKSAGFKQVVPIKTGMIKVGRKWIHAEKVAGDIRAVGPAGVSVLVESKYRTEDVLVWSDLETHQVRHLDEHHAAHGISLLAWSSPMGIAILRWPVFGFGPGRSLRDLPNQVCFDGRKP